MCLVVRALSQLQQRGQQHPRLCKGTVLPSQGRVSWHGNSKLPVGVAFIRHLCNSTSISHLAVAMQRRETWPLQSTLHGHESYDYLNRSAENVLGQQASSDPRQALSGKLVQHEYSSLTTLHDHFPALNFPQGLHIQPNATLVTVLRIMTMVFTTESKDALCMCT